MEKLFLLTVIVIFLAVIAAKTIRTVDEDERLVVFRLGQLLNVYPPGRAVLIPFLDQGVKVKVEQVAGWQTLTEAELLEKSVEAALQKLAK